MTDKEIIKALIVCDSAFRGCEDCPYIGQDDCMRESTFDALDLIKRQQERIEEYEILDGLRNKRHYYNRFIKEVWQKEKGELSHPDFDEIYKRYFDQQEKIDELTDREAGFAFDRIHYNIKELNLMQEGYNIEQLKKRFRADFEEHCPRPEMYEVHASWISFSTDKSGELWIDIGGFDYRLDDFGKTVFLTKAEAEAKLAELKGDE